MNTNEAHNAIRSALDSGELSQSDLLAAQSEALQGATPKTALATLAQAEIDLAERLARHNCTYCPEDNKLRFYPDWSDTSFDKEHLKAAGFRWASKQECYVCPRWTPQAEDAALEYVDEIGDEDYSPQERAADRAERFSGYRDNRRADAGDHADAFDAGPQVHGYQSQTKADRAAARHDRQRVKAVSQWSKAEYWQDRTAGVIRNALHRSRPEVRRSRILTLEAEQRKHQKEQAEHRERYEAWQQIATMDGADVPLTFDAASGWPDLSNANAAQLLANQIAGDGRCRFCFPHPTNDEVNAKARELWGHDLDIYSLLCRNDFAGIPYEPLSPRAVAELVLSRAANPDEYGKRWADHYANRLAYENAMLENEGGKASEVEIIPGGFVRTVDGWRQVQKVNKSRATGRVVSVVIWGETTGYTRESNYTQRETRPCLVKRNIERHGEDVYRAPTAEELAEFQAEQKAANKSAPKVPKLINPTPEDAERLQAWRNAQQPDRTPSEVIYTTQAKYSYLSKGDAVSTQHLTADGKQTSDQTRAACKIRQAWRMYGPDAVIVLTDKPQKPLPIDWAALEQPAELATC